MKIVLIGWPIGHSISPAIQNAAFKALGLAGEYSLLPVEREADLSGAIAGLKADSNWMGANVTVPYKEKIIPLLQGLEGASARLKAVNTILRWGDTVIGHNTDMPAFLADLDRNGMEFRGSPALVIGSGGAARAVVRGLVESRCPVAVVAVVREQAEALARELGEGLVDVLAWDDPALRGKVHSARLVVNTSPVGMWPKVDESPWPDAVPFPEKACVYDLVYNPVETRFLREANARGMKTAGGLGMLVEQAAQAFRIWTGAEGPREVMMRAARIALSEREEG
jgi:shikimate dehydrogenase